MTKRCNGVLNLLIFDCLLVREKDRQAESFLTSSSYQEILINAYFITLSSWQNVVLPSVAVNADCYEENMGRVCRTNRIIIPLGG